MPDSYENLHDLEDLDDEEIHDLVVEKLDEYPEIDPEFLDIDVDDGVVTLSGRVGTEQEWQVADQVLGDVLGIEEYSNELIVDELVRAEQSEAADESVADDEAVDAGMGEEGEVTQDTADHLVQDTESETYGTHDMHKAVERGETYNPPDRPIQKGNRSKEQH